MAFLRYSRDKRGYDHYHLVQSSVGRRGKARQRILYWYRTPPNVKVGREPFDREVRLALEAQYPDIPFDWLSLSAPPTPPPDVERWRERRRAERAARQAAETDDADQSAELEETAEARREQADAVESPGPASSIAGGADVASAVTSSVPDTFEPASAAESERDAAPAARVATDMTVAAPTAAAGATDPSSRRRRRRRGGRRNRRPDAGTPQSTAMAASPSADAPDAPETPDAPDMDDVADRPSDEPQGD